MFSQNDCSEIPRSTKPLQTFVEFESLSLESIELCALFTGLIDQAVLKLFDVELRAARKEQLIQRMRRLGYKMVEKIDAGYWPV